ncbi:MAG: molybdate ABC transporter substrate-binding protein [Methanomicrobiaceae archaeon]|uniref:Molybdenum abc transporter, periplasmic molybdenum-binding protein moda n=1 Tax=hydrocarbon metagenome TaxID=938273 RepID=A0A0W8FF79_9ZZZZ|nr:molybdate ABC transporter substrate-binding protein [Methanomicrobiaceae archaeon]
MRQSPFIVIAAILLAAVCISGCIGNPAQSGGDKTELTVFAAASLTEAMTDIKNDYETMHPDIRVTLNLDGSQALRTQIEQGAYADVFLSANTRHLYALRDQGLMENDTIGLFAKNRLAVIVPAANPGNIASLEDLARPGIRLVIGTKDVPVGDYARQILDKMADDDAYGPSYREAVQNNVMSEETAVTHIVAKVQLGEADAGIAYESDVSPRDRDTISMIPIPDTYNVIAEYPAGVLKCSGNRDEALHFIRYLQGEQGGEVLARYGFAKP